MACFEINNNNNTTRNDTILDLLKRIDKMQKEAILANAQGTCNTCIIAPVFNTKPIGIYLCNELLTAALDDETTTNRFRVEEVRGDVVILRLLAVAEGELTCTNQTITVKVSCICAIQCFDPITCVINCALAV